MNRQSPGRVDCCEIHRDWRYAAETGRDRRGQQSPVSVSGHYNDDILRHEII